MTEHDLNSPDKLDAEIEKMLASDASLKTAIKSQNALLRVAARVVLAPHPSSSDPLRARIFQQVQAKTEQAPRKLKSKPVVYRPASFWMSLAKMAAGFAVLLFVVGLITIPAAASSIYLPPKNRPQAKLGKTIMRATCGEKKHEQKT